MAARLICLVRRMVSSPADGLSDGALLGRFVRARDESAFAALVERHGPMVRRVCRRVLGDVHAADDAFQATFLVLARKATAVGRPEALAGWLYGVAHRASLKARTANARHANGSATDIETLSDSSPDPLTRLTARELLTALDEEVRRLPEAYRQPVILCCLEGLSQEEAARRLGWSPGSVKGRLERGRERLRERLTKRGLTLAAALAAAEVTRGAAVVPGLLAAATVRAAMAFGTREGCGATNAAALAEAVLSGMSLPRRHVFAALVLAITLAAGTGAIAARHRQDDSQGEKIAAEKPKAKEAEPVRTDRYGDALPDDVIARLGTLRLRGNRGCLTFSPDGKVIASAGGSAGNAVLLWDRATGREVRRVTDNHPTLLDVRFSPDGKRLLAVTNSSFCVLYDAETTKPLFKLRGGHGAFSGDGTKIVTADGYGSGPKITVWDAATGQAVRDFPLKEGAEHFALAADNRTLAIIDKADPSVVEVREVAKGEAIRRLKIDGNVPRFLSVSPDGTAVATGNMEGVRLWDVATGKETRSWRQRTDSLVVFSRDGKRLAWTGYDPSPARVWLADRDGEAPRAVGAPTNCFTAPAFSPDGKALAVLTDGGVVEVRDVATGKNLLPFDGHDGPVTRLVVTEDGAGVVSSGRDGVLAWDVATGRVVRRHGDYYAEGEATLAVLAGGRLLTGERKTGVARVREALTGRETLRFEGRFDVGAGNEPAASVNGKYVVLRDKKGVPCVFDALTGRLLYRFDLEGSFCLPAISTDGRTLAGFRHPPGEAKAPCLRDPETGKLRVLPAIPEDKVSQGFRLCLDARCFSPDGLWFVFVGNDGTLRRWDLTTGKEASALGEAQSSVWDVLWSPDGRLVALRGSEAQPGVIDREARVSLRVWDVAAGKALTHVDPPHGGGGSVLFSPDGRTLLTTDSDAVIHFWEVATGQERRTLKGHLPAWVNSLALSRDGRVLVSGGQDTQVLVWDLTGRAADGHRRPLKLTPEELNRAWDALAGDAARAYRALGTLADDAAGTTAFLRERLKPVAKPEPGRVAKLIAELDGDEFATRDRAAKELEGFGGAVVGDLRRALTTAPSAEARRSLGAILDRLERPTPTGRELQELRAIEALEYLGDARGRLLLEALAGGASGARLTEEARRAARRLGLSSH